MGINQHRCFYLLVFSVRDYLSSQFQRETASATPTKQKPYLTQDKTESLPLSVAQNASEICYFYDNCCHQRSKCPAHDIGCNKCGKKGHLFMECH